MPTVDVNGVSLYWAERGAGPTVLFVHGIPTDFRAWDAQTGALAPGFRTVTYSRRYAHPNLRSGDLSDSTVENNAADLAGLIARLDLAPVHLVGHSYGGFVAAYLATEQPELLRSLTLVEPAIASLLLRDPNRRSEALALLLRHPRVALSARRYLRTAHHPALEALRRNDLAAAVRFNLDGVEDRRGSFERLPEPMQKMVLDNARTVKEADTPYPALSRGALSGIRTPTLVIHGQTSVLWLRTVADMTGVSVPGCHVVAIPNSGHFPHFQNPTAFNYALVPFLYGSGTPRERASSAA